MIIDLDSHLREAYVLDEVYKLDGAFASMTPKREGEGRMQHARFTYDFRTDQTRAGRAFDHGYIYDPDEKWQGGEIAARQVGGIDMERRLLDANQEGIDHQVIFPTRISIPTLTPGELGVALAKAYNNWVSNLVRDHKDRFFPVAMAPAGHPSAMADELRRCVKELGFKAAHLPVYTTEHLLSDAVFDPYFEAVEELDVPLFCHPNSLGEELINRYDSFFTQHVLGRPVNCLAAMASLVLDGVLERFPRLKVCFFEVSAEFPLYWMHRMDEDWEWAKLEPRTRHGDLSMPPSSYIKRNCYFTCEADEPHLDRSLEEIPEDHVLMASDYPHFDSEWPHTVSSIQERGDLTKRQKELILGENAAQLLKI